MLDIEKNSNENIAHLENGKDSAEKIWKMGKKKEFFK